MTTKELPIEDCAIEGCGKKVFGRGWCTKHYQRWRRHGNPLTTVIRPKGHPDVDRDGYVRILQGGRPYLEHRWVMEQELGRRLREDETVHHINGDRSDNRVENLQLRTGLHGPGVRLVCNSCGSSDIEPAALDGELLKGEL